MSDKIRLTSIDLTTKEGQEVKLGIDEARALYAQLRELFGEKINVAPERYPVPMPYPVPVYPPIIIPREERPWLPWRPRWEITCGGGQLNTSDSSGLRVRYSGTVAS